MPEKGFIEWPILHFWRLSGKLIVEDEQMGNAKAQYGKATLKRLSQALTLEFGKGYDESNLRNIRSFFIAFPILDALRQELSNLILQDSSFNLRKCIRMIGS